MESFASRVCQIPELVSTIFSHVDEPRTMAKCIRVNKLWFSEGAPILWRGRWDEPYWGSPDPEQMKWVMRDEKRFAGYLKFVSHFELDLTKWWPLEMAVYQDRGLNALSLQSLRIKTGKWEHAPDMVVRRFLGPRLSKIEFPRSTMRSLFWHVQIKCPNLKELYLPCAGVVKHASFINAVVKMKNLHKLFLEFSVAADSDALAIAVVARILTEMPNLTDLDIDASSIREPHGTIHPVRWNGIRRRNNVQCNIKRLKFQAFRGSGWSQVFRGLQKLEHVEITDREPNRYSLDCLKVFAKNPNLRRVRVRLHPKATTGTLVRPDFSFDDMFSLAKNAPLLTELDLGILEMNRGLCNVGRDLNSQAEFSAPQLQSILAALPNLEILNFPVSCSLTGGDFSAIGNACPKLRSCQLQYVDIDFAEIALEGIPITKFASLRHLAFRDYMTTASADLVAERGCESTAKAICALIAESMPRMRALVFRRQPHPNFDDDFEYPWYMKTPMWSVLEAYGNVGREEFSECLANEFVVRLRNMEKMQEVWTGIPEPLRLFYVFLDD